MLLKKLIPVIVVCVLHTSFVFSMQDERARPQIPFETIGYHDDIILSIDTFFQSDQNLIVSGSRDKTIRIWSIESKKRIRILKGHTDSVTCVKVIKHKLGNIIVSASEDATLRLWDVETGECTGVLEGDLSPVIALELIGDYIVAGHKNGKIAIWDPISREIERSFYHGQGPVQQLAALGELTLASASGKSVKIWNIETQECLWDATIPTDNNSISGLLGVGDDSTEFLVSIEDTPGVYSLWNWKDKKCESTCPDWSEIGIDNIIKYQGSLIFGCPGGCGGFTLYDYKANKITWGAYVEGFQPTPYCVAIVNGYIIYSGAITNDLRISCNQVFNQ